MKPAETRVQLSEQPLTPETPIAEAGAIWLARWRVPELIATTMTTILMSAPASSNDTMPAQPLPAMKQPFGFLYAGPNETDAPAWVISKSPIW